MRHIAMLLLLALAGAAAGAAEEEILIPGMLEVSMPSGGKRQKEQLRTRGGDARPAAEKEAPSVPAWCEEQRATVGDDAKACERPKPAPRQENKPAAQPQRPEPSPLPDDLDAGVEQEIIPFPAAETMSQAEEERPMSPPATNAAAPRAEARLAKPS
ncbi:MAG: hypothetical protein N3A66_01405, partial [Planctomycetota bacterium]|nr:hypothetical protein [Planctomycetota bacterium]